MSADVKPLLDVAAALGRLRAPWWISGGWAIDLHLGRVTRAHHDVDVAILRDDEALLHDALDGFALHKIIPHPDGLLDRGAIEPWQRGERLELPVHQIDVMRAGSQMRPQTEDVAFQLLLQESRGGTWLYRRNPDVTRPIAAIEMHALWSLPYLAPEIVLLFKAKHCLDKDRADFDACRDSLSADARAWLKNALALCHPSHDWIARL
ncbi:MAG: nucleotidyltransferase domain-containing protein [Candidatus Binataceae bacterium]